MPGAGSGDAMSTGDIQNVPSSIEVAPSDQFPLDLRTKLFERKLLEMLRPVRLLALKP